MSQQGLKSGRERVYNTDLGYLFVDKATAIRLGTTIIVGGSAVFQFSCTDKSKFHTFWTCKRTAQNDNPVTGFTSFLVSTLIGLCVPLSV